MVDDFLSLGVSRTENGVEEAGDSAAGGGGFLGFLQLAVELQGLRFRPGEPAEGVFGRRRGRTGGGGVGVGGGEDAAGGVGGGGGVGREVA